MTDKNAELDGYADIPLEERRRIEVKREKAHREGILRRHFETNGVPHMAPGADGKD